ncbi:hypothetical protein NE237_012906 [Protea cynaroides]|uniref:Cytochrome P450 n=1 Tax=Protea cynaroides TaxID=273540 RepID=A0A9Q0H0P6_9MAGN|nr:hypothetical protein NE237_012906 [Protea cynaroides]
MDFFQFLQVLGFAMLFFIIFIGWLSPIRAYKRVRKNGFEGPKPKKKEKTDSPLGSVNVTHNIHSIVFSYFARWRKLHGKLFLYWLGMEPFLYVADPEFLNEMSSGVIAKNWGKPNVFKYDRKSIFGNGLLMLEGDDWVHHRNIIAPALSPANIKFMASSMVESVNRMLDQWVSLIASSETAIDVEKDITITAAEIIAKLAFGINDENGRKLFEKLRALQLSLFKCNRLVGVRFSKFMDIKQTLESRKIGKEIDRDHHDQPQQDLLGFLLSDSKNNKKKLTERELVDECKTFFFGGHETTALAITWTLLHLALHPEWQNHLREEIEEEIGDGPLDPTMLARLKKSIWGDEVHEFRPERLKDGPNGGSKHRVGYLAFGFGGRICVGKNLAHMEYKTMLTLILRRDRPPYRQPNVYYRDWGSYRIIIHCMKSSCNFVY